MWQTASLPIISDVLTGCLDVQDVKTYAGSMQVQQAKAFKTDGQDGLDILLRVLAPAAAVNHVVGGRNSSWMTQRADTPSSLMPCGSGGTA